MFDTAMKESSLILRFPTLPSGKTPSLAEALPFIERVLISWREFLPLPTTTPGGALPTGEKPFPYTAAQQIKQLPPKKVHHTNQTLLKTSDLPTAKLVKGSLWDCWRGK